MRESTTGSDTSGEVPKQHPDVEQTPLRRATGVTIREPSSTPRASAPPVSKGKGKKKATEPLEPLNESSDENDMDSECVFDIYSAPEAPATPSSKKKTSKRHPGESSKVPQAKKPRTARVPKDGPSANATPPPSPHEQQTPPAPAGSTPSPAAPTDQTQQAGHASTGGNITSRAFRSVKDRVAKIVKHDCC
ncbi:predicted GPI-anchored protein 58 [Humulus lupulus]|uniref:predicted GPI-anchored protein 58 n=1 Tax=Humulus lupulus TaxID=3486 RepID=UPI002B408105|nr:predicted GPI-anchored protein 58 [Humulus lupulus]